METGRIQEFRCQDPPSTLNVGYVAPDCGYFVPNRHLKLRVQGLKELRV